MLVTLPDGEELAGDDPALGARLSELCGRRVALVPLPPAHDRRAFRGGMVSGAAIRRELGLGDDDPLPDAGDMPLRTLASVARYSTPPGLFADLAPLQLLTTTAVAGVGAALAADPHDAAVEDGPGGVAVRRFRPSVLVEPDGATAPPSAADAFPERCWVGHEVHVGAARLPVTMPTVRCVVPTREQPGLERRRQLGRALGGPDGRFLGVYADVARGGEVRVGDEVRLDLREPGAWAAATTRVRRAVVRTGGRLLG